MNKFFIFLLSLMSTPCLAQLKAPEQIDTLHIKAVKYNFCEIRPENWPCMFIIKSTTNFTIIGQTFEITSVREGSIKYSCDEIIFTLTDGSELSYYEREDLRAVEYSGYEFICDGISSPEPESKKHTGPNAHVPGRSVNGPIPPVHSVKASGAVVVDIWVDRHGNVTKAVAGGAGTTVTDKSVWEEARKSALQAHFNMSTDTKALQQGTITYVF